MTVAEAVKAVGRLAFTIWQKCDRGKIPATEHGGNWTMSLARDIAVAVIFVVVFGWLGIELNPAVKALLFP